MKNLKVIEKELKEFFGQGTRVSLFYFSDKTMLNVTITQDYDICWPSGGFLASLQRILKITDGVDLNAPQFSQSSGGCEICGYGSTSSIEFEVKLK